MELVRLLQELPEKRKQLIVGAASVVAGVAILIGYFQSGPNALTYAEAESAFAKWEASPQDEALYQAMRQAIKAVPALERKYEPIIVQQLLNTARIQDALVMADRSLHRVEQEAPFHTSYARTSLFIEQGKFQEALERAVALKEEMGSLYTSKKGGAVLHAYNLLRIACLQQALHNRAGEKAALDELEQFLSAKGVYSSEVFSEKELTRYVTERRKGL